MSSAHAQAMDFLAYTFRRAGREAMPLRDLCSEGERAGYGALWHMKRQEVANGLAVRGLTIVDGEVRETSAVAAINEPPPDLDIFYTEFTEAAHKVMAEAKYPVDALELIARCTLGRQMRTPGTELKTVMRTAGYAFIPGAGYWRHSVYTDEHGMSIGAGTGSPQSFALSRAFANHGWPIVGKDAEQWTGGLVTSRYLIFASKSGPARKVAGIGSGLYVPPDRLPDGPVPMSPGVAKVILDLAPGYMLDDHEHFRLFRIALALRRAGFADVVLSRTKRNGIRRQTAKLTLTGKGKEAIEAFAAKANSRDEF